MNGTILWEGLPHGSLSPRLKTEILIQLIYSDVQIWLFLDGQGECLTTELCSSFELPHSWIEYQISSTSHHLLVSRYLGGFE